MNLSIMSATKVHAAYALIALCALIAAPFALVQAGTLTVNKEIQGTSTVPFTDFSFTINGASTTQFDADGNNDVVLDAGTYIIEEVPVSGYTTTYTDCDSVALTATSTATCTITNTATSTSTSTPTTTPATGTILVEKVVVGGSETAAAFSVTLNGGATTTFDGSGEVVFGDLATGTYSVSEVPFANYTPTYSNCMNITVNSGATTTCTVTNTFNVGGGQLYEITGIVWDDEDENGTLDSGENTLSGWMVRAEQSGEITRTDVTDANGRYELLVTDGAWIVSQVQQSGWDQTFPSGGTHTVNATGTATTTIELGDYNFGNDRDESSSSGGGGGGNGIRIELRDDDDDDDDDGAAGRTDDDDEDEDDDDDSSFPFPGAVLGEQTSIYPTGAPATGLGGMSDLKGTNAALPLISIIMVILAGFGVARAMRDPRYDEEEIV